MATDVAVLIARLEADVRDFDRDLKKAGKRLGKLENTTEKAGRAADKTAGKFKGMGGAMKAVFAGAAAAGAIKFVKNLVGETTDLNESINAVNVVFGEAAEGVLAIGENAAVSLGLANSEFNSLAVSFSAFVEKVVGPGGDVVGTLEELTTRAADFASVMNLDVAEAATIFRSALAGETEAIRRFGVDVSAAAITAEALATGVANSAAEMSEADKIAIRYSLLMQGTADTQSDFDNTATDAANAMRILSKRFKDVKASLGQVFVKAIEDVAPELNNLLDTLEEMGPVLEVVIDDFLDLASGVVELIDKIGFLIIKWGEFKDTTSDLSESENAFNSFVGQLGNFVTSSIPAQFDLFWEKIVGRFQADEAVENLLAVSGAARTAGRSSKGAAGQVAPLAKELTAVEKAAENATEKIVTYEAKVAAMIDPALSAAQSLIALKESELELAEFFEDDEATVEEYNLALLELAAQKIATEIQLRELDTLGVTTAIGAIAVALGISSEAARQLLEDLGLIDGLEVTAVVNLEGKGGFADVIRETDRNAGIIPLLHQGGIVPGPPGADVPIVAQAGERIIPTSQVSEEGGGGDINIVIEGDLTEPVFEDLQRELILESIGRFVETR